VKFGRIDIPEGGALPPAPMFATVDGRELVAEWRDETPADYPAGRRVYVPRFEINQETWDLGILRWAMLTRNSTAPVRSPWGHKLDITTKSDANR